VGLRPNTAIGRAPRASVRCRFGLVVPSPALGVRKPKKAGLVHPRPQQITVAVLGHPTRASKMGVVHAGRALTIAVRVEPEQHPHDFRPFRTLGGCVQKTKIKCEVLAIIIGQARTLRGRIGKRQRCLCARTALLSRSRLANSRS
jgi:hypothetical protein